MDNNSNSVPAVDVTSHPTLPEVAAVPASPATDLTDAQIQAIDHAEVTEPAFTNLPSVEAAVAETSDAEVPAPNVQIAVIGEVENAEVAEVVAPINATLKRAFRTLSLSKARSKPSRRHLAAHQNEALIALKADFGRAIDGPRGSIVVLPTGGGKTLTAVRFLFTVALLQGYKVLWLSNTYHLVDQPFGVFAPSEDASNADGMEAGLIPEPHRSLQIRAVSGKATHFPASAIEASDDVVIATLQTMTGAIKRLADLPGLEAFSTAERGFSSYLTRLIMLRHLFTAVSSARYAKFALTFTSWD